jgi:hypothetical protein
MVIEMIVAILVGLVILLAIFGFMALLMPDMSYFLMSSVLTPEQIESTSSVAVPYYPDTINVIPIIPFVIIGFILIMLFALVRRS